MSASYPPSPRAFLAVLVGLSAIALSACTSSVPSSQTGASTGSDSGFGSQSQSGEDQSQSRGEVDAPMSGPVATWLDDPQEQEVIAFGPGVADVEEVWARYVSVTPTAWGLVVPGVITHMDSDSIALTLDACGGPGGSGFDSRLIDGLIERQIPATLFLNERWIMSNYGIAQALAANPLFQIENHGTQHKPLSVQGNAAYGIEGTASVAEAIEEVWSNRQVISDLTGTPPKFFRSGTAHYDDVAVQVVDALGERVVGFTVNADAGATYSAEQVHAAVVNAAPGSILIAHMNQPQGGTADGLLAGIDDLLARGIRFSWIENPVG